MELSFIKKLNSTELGLGNTHDSYVAAKKDILTNFFNDSNPIFYDYFSDKKYDEIHISTPGKELRINGLGNFYKNNNASPGDEVIFTKTTKSYLIGLKKSGNIATLSSTSSKGFEILHQSNLDSYKNNESFNLNLEFNGEKSNIEIRFSSREKKRSDSPNEADFYHIFKDNVNLLNELKGRGFVEIKSTQRGAILCKSPSWKFYKFY